jgi:hypothetical protein
MGFRTAGRRRIRKRTTGTPRPRTYDMSRQVSWLAGRRLGPAFPGSFPVAMSDLGSPLTVAGAAPALLAISAVGNERTGFPLRFRTNETPEEPRPAIYGRLPIVRQDWRKVGTPISRQCLSPSARIARTVAEPSTGRHCPAVTPRTAARHRRPWTHRKNAIGSAP